MIYFKRNGQNVEAELHFNTPTLGSRYCTVSINAGNPTNADFLTQAYKDRLFETLKGLREEAYNQGWKDAKAKRTKSKWFKGVW